MRLCDVAKTKSRIDEHEAVHRFDEQAVVGQMTAGDDALRTVVHQLAAEGTR